MPNGTLWSSQYQRHSGHVPSSVDLQHGATQMYNIHFFAPHLLHGNPQDAVLPSSVIHIVTTYLTDNDAQLSLWYKYASYPAAAASSGASQLHNDNTQPVELFLPTNSSLSSVGTGNAQWIKQPDTCDHHSYSTNIRSYVLPTKHFKEYYYCHITALQSLLSCYVNYEMTPVIITFMLINSNTM